MARYLTTDNTSPAVPLADIPELPYGELYDDLADRLAQKADFAAVFSGNDGEGYKYVMCSAHTDVAALGKKFNETLNGRGGGRNPMVQGSVMAERAKIEEFLLT